MREEIRYYKGKHKVAVLSRSRGSWVVEALESFCDVVYGKKISVNVGERRIVSPNLLKRRRGLGPPVKEHVYELKMEKKLKQMISDTEDEKTN